MGTMSEPMGTSFDVTKLTLKDATGQATHTPSLLSSVARSGATGKTVTVSFHGDDLDFIKALPLLAVSDASTVLTLTTDFAVDTTGVQIKALTSIDNKTPASNGGYGEDTKHPNLTGFVLDLKTNTLRLTFDETVKADGINLNGIRLLASKGATDADEIYQLQTDKNNVQCARTQNVCGLSVVGDNGKGKTVHTTPTKMLYTFSLYSFSFWAFPDKTRLFRLTAVLQFCSSQPVPNFAHPFFKTNNSAGVIFYSFYITFILFCVHHTRAQATTNGDSDAACSLLRMQPTPFFPRDHLIFYFFCFYPLLFFK